MTIASDYRHYITIYLREALGLGDRGQTTYTMNVVGTVYARITTLEGKKLDLARQVIASATHEIRIRYLEGVTPECDITFGDRVFEIGSVNNRNEVNFEMVLTCIERQ